MVIYLKIFSIFFDLISKFNFVRFDNESFGIGYDRIKILGCFDLNVLSLNF